MAGLASASCVRTDCNHLRGPDPEEMNRTRLKGWHGGGDISGPLGLSLQIQRRGAGVDEKNKEAFYKSAAVMSDDK